MTRVPTEEELYGLLESRIGPLHLRQRLGIEAEREGRVFGQGRTFFHIENWYVSHRIIRALLRLSFLHGRGRRNALSLRVRHNDLAIANLPAAFEGFSILQISDLHLDMNEQFPEALADCVAPLQYDACVLTGDFRYRTYGPCAPALDGMSRVRDRLKNPVLGILGNHDSIRMVPVLEAMGIRMLMNESISIDRDGVSIYLAGIDDPHYYRADNMDRAYREIPRQAVSILLAHSPEIYRQAAHAGFDVMLCGHTHGGQLALPGGIPVLYNASCPREFCAGAWAYHTLRGFTSVGAGSTIVDVRLNCPPEVVLHRLHRPVDSAT